MKITRKNSKKRSKILKRTAKRLAAYSAAAAATVVTTQHRSASADDDFWDILDITANNSTNIQINFVNGTYKASGTGFSAGNTLPGSFAFAYGGDWLYAPVGDFSAGFAKPAPCTDCGTSFGPLYVYPLPMTNNTGVSNVSAGNVFAGNTNYYPSYGNFANAYYFYSDIAAKGSILGVRFTLNGGADTHYGWAAITNTLTGGVIIHGFGYNDTPGAPSVPDLTTVDLPGDINRDGEVDLDDWIDLRDNIGADLSAETRADAYARGDIDFNGLNDIRDFDFFREAYEDANGNGSFAAMVGGVPEPSSIMLLAAGAAGLGMWRKKRAG